MKTKILFIICFTTFAVQLFAQEKHLTTDQYIDLQEENETSFFPPKGFSESEINVKDVRSVFRRTIPSEGYLALLSKDKQCLVVYSGQYNTMFKRVDFPTAETTIAQAYASFLRRNFTGDLQDIYGPEVILDDHLTVLSGEKATKQFNADSVYIYTLPVNNDRLQPYTHGVCMMLMRFPNYLSGIYLFVTDKGYGKIDKYMSKIEGSVMFWDTPKDPNGDLDETYSSFGTEYYP